MLPAAVYLMCFDCSLLLLGLHDSQTDFTTRQARDNLDKSTSRLRTFREAREWERGAKHGHGIYTVRGP